MINADRSYSTPLMIKNYKISRCTQFIRSNFNNKCYFVRLICILPIYFKLIILSQVNENQTFTKTWVENLYLICSDCNKSRPKHAPSGGLMDPYEDRL